MIQSEWGHDIELKYTYKNENIGEIKTYTLNLNIILIYGIIIMLKVKSKGE